MSQQRPVFSTSLCRLLGIDYPIIQSGMGDVAGPELAAEVSNAGGLGVLAATLTRPDALRRAIRELRAHSDRPFGVNLLLLPELVEPTSTDDLADAEVAAVHAALAPLRHALGLPDRTNRPPTVPALLDAAIEVVVDEEVPVLSVGLGDPGPDLTARLHAAGVKTVVMVTNSADARRVEANGADVIVAQGLEAGGHRSHFVKPTGPLAQDLGTVALVPEIVASVSVPVVAAGGIVDGRGLVAALALGASGVLMGTRFLASRESMAPDAHKKRILEASGDHTVVTDAVSGRYARVLRNELSAALEGAGSGPLPFPSQYLANADVRAAAAEIGDAEHLPLWCSQAAGLLDDLPWAADVVTDTIREARRLLVDRLADVVALGVS